MNAFIAALALALGSAQADAAAPLSEAAMAGRAASCLGLGLGAAALVSGNFTEPGAAAQTGPLPADAPKRMRFLIVSPAGACTLGSEMEIAPEGEFAYLWLEQPAAKEPRQFILLELQELPGGAREFAGAGY
ncbi:MAG TPA: hypothetical protein VHC68_02665 [Candidatus Paceibacterota bacterium]|nr:hypothetical protein [Candidatus Paceibacterota bacterium]